MSGMVRVWLAYKVLDLSNVLWFAGVDGAAAKLRSTAKLLARSRPSHSELTDDEKKPSVELRADLIIATHSDSGFSAAYGVTVSHVGMAYCPPPRTIGRSLKPSTNSEPTHSPPPREGRELGWIV